MFYLRKYAKVIRCKSCNGIIGLQISKSIKSLLCIFALALAVSEILTFEDVHLQPKVDKVQEYNLALTTFDGKCQNLHIFAIGRSRSQSTLFGMMQIDGKCQILKKTYTFMH